MSSKFTFKFALVFAACMGLSVSAIAQSTAASAPVVASEAKTALAQKMVALQSGPEMDRTVYQLTSGAMQPLIGKWAPRMESLPADKIDKAREQLNTELKKSGDATRRDHRAQLPKSGASVLVQAYLDRFTEEELRTLVGIFEAEAFKKYQAVAPDLGNIWIKDVIEHSREGVLAEGKRFDDAAAKIVGEAPAAKKAEPKTEPKTEPKADAKKAEPKPKAEAGKATKK